MQIKNVREPNEEEKQSTVPKLMLFGVTTAIVTSVIYLITLISGQFGKKTIQLM